jgi:hypothetical protein
MESTIATIASIGTIARIQISTPTMSPEAADYAFVSIRPTNCRSVTRGDLTAAIGADRIVARAGLSAQNRAGGKRWRMVRKVAAYATSNVAAAISINVTIFESPECGDPQKRGAAFSMRFYG